MINTELYTSSQIDLFLDINKTLSEMGIVWLNITALGDAIVLFPLLSLLIIKNPQAWAALFGAIPLSAILSHTGKAFFAIPRPAAIIDNSEFTIMGDVLSAANSLPSGHTITIFAAASAILFVFIYGNKKVNHLIIWGITLFSLAAVIALSRVAVGAHWPFDLLLGALFGCLGGISGAILTFKYANWWQWMANPKSKYIHIAILLTFVFAMMSSYFHLIIAWISLTIASFVVAQLLIPGTSHEQR